MAATGGMRGKAAAVTATLAILLAPGAAAVLMSSSAAGAGARAAAAAPASSSGLLDLGRRTYAQQCAPCHGADGRGEGPASWLLYPKPRDFTAARFALVSSWERVPTDDDLLATITRGMPGSAMPAWGHLPERTRRALVQYVKSLAAEPWSVAEGAAPEGAPPRGAIAVPPEPPYDAEARARARMMFAEACAACHGPAGKGDGGQEQFDDKGFPTRPRDLTLGVFKGDPRPESVYRRIVAGMPGTPMPMSDWAHGADAWHLTHFVRELSSDAQRQRVEMRSEVIEAARVTALPDHPDSSLWTRAAPVHVPLMPLWWRSDRPEALEVRALHDGREVALLVVWEDATHDHTAMRVQDFRDAVAVELALEPDPPFFAMGEKGRFVNVWMWKSERQADLEPAFQDLDKVYPNIGIDSYPNLSRSPLEQPTRQALTLDSDRTFVTGWGAGNLVSDPLRGSAAEDLVAQGFGTLQARPEAGAALVSRGVFSTGTYRVLFRRALRVEGRTAARLAPGGATPIAFAVFNGTAGDRDGKKSVTIWQELRLAR